MHRNAVFFLTILIAPALFGPLLSENQALHSSVVQAQSLSPSELEKLGLEMRWIGQAVMDVRRDSVTSVVNDESNVYVQASSGMLTVFQAEDGRKLWSVQVGRADESSFPAISNSNVVVIVAGPTIYAYNKFSGTPMFEFRLPAIPTAGPAVDEQFCYIPTDGGTMNCYSLAVLEYLFRYDQLPPAVNRAVMWRFVTAELIRYPAVIGDKAISFATDAGSFYSVENTGTNRGRTRAQIIMNRPVTAKLTAVETRDGTSVLALTGDNRIFSLDMMTGNTNWTYPLGSSLTRSPIVVGPDVFLATEDGAMLKMDRDTSSITWGRPSEVSLYASPMLIGAGMVPAPDDSPVSGLQVTEVYADSPALAAGLQAGDIITSIDDRPVDSIETAQALLKELPPGVPRPMEVSRQGQVQSLNVRIPSREWRVTGVGVLKTVGRFAVYATDSNGRVLGFDRETGDFLGRINAQKYNLKPQNTVTDQVYLATSSGEIVCLREIGPMLRMPELSSASRTIQVSKVHVTPGSRIEETGTVICEVELPDGSIQEVKSDHKGVVRTVYIKDGQTVSINDPLVLIADDHFATYHRSPEQRPVDVQLSP